MLRKHPSSDDLAGETVAHARTVQQQFWLLQQMVPDVGISNIGAKLSWSGPLDILTMQEALLDLVRRHSYLRTRVEYIDGELQQIVYEPVAIPVSVVDLRSVDGDLREARVEAALNEAAQTPLPADSIPWIRAQAVRLEDQRFEIALVVSHLICDGLSMGVLCAELMQAYTSRLSGQAPTWRNESHIDLRSGELEVEKPDAEAPRFDLPYDRPASSAPSYRGARLEMALNADESKALIALSRAHKVSPFVTWLTLMHVVAFRYSRASQIEVEIPLSGRDRRTRRAVGPLLQSTTARLAAAGHHTFAELLTANAAAFQEANERPSHKASRRAQLLLDYQSALDEVPLTDEITVVPGEIGNGTALAELRVGIRRRRRHFEVQIDYDVDLFNEETASRFGAHLKRVVKIAAADPECPLDEMELLTEPEQLLLLDVNRTATDYESAQSADQMFVECVAQHPHSKALTQEDRMLSYAELDAMVGRIAHRLSEEHVKQGDRVAILLDRGVEAVASTLAILRCKATFVPIDPKYPEERQALILKHAKACCVLTNDLYRERVPDAVPIVDVNDATRAENSTLDAPAGDHVSETDIAYVLFTSGSTGVPKGVQITHGNLANFFVGMDELQPSQLPRPGCWLALTSMSFDISIYELLWTLSRGYHVVIEDDPLDLTSDNKLADRILRCNATHLQCTPAMMQAILREPANEQAIGTLDRIFIGGDAMPLALATELADLARGEVYNMYGPTETTIWSTAWRVSRNVNEVLIGKPIANTQIHVLDSALRPFPVGVVGELYIGGDGVAAGYFENPQQTEERFLLHSDYGRMFRTGDLVRMRSDGNLEFLGRADQQIKFNGHRLELGEIEVALLDCEHVEQAVAVLHEPEGESKKIVAFLRTGECDWDQHRESIFATLRKRLPSYMIPARIERLEQLPLTPARKVDRKLLMTRALPSQREAKTNGDNGNGAHDLSSAGLTEQVRRIICEELQLESLPKTADLAALGVNSLEVVRLADRVEREFGIRPPISLFFRSTSLDEAIAETLETSQRVATPRPVDIAPTEAELSATKKAEAPRSTKSSAMDRLSQVSDSFREAFGNDSLHPYARYVDPIKSELLARAGLDRAYARGEGCFLWDHDGNQVVDFVAQYGALPFGYNPPEIWQALERMRQSQLPNLATNSLLDSAGELAGRLLRLVPKMRHVVFCNSGAECTEIAIKLCRSRTGRKKMLSTRKGFHGLTTGAVGVTGSDSFRDGFVADDDNFQHVPFGDFEALEEALEQSADEIAGFIVEPIQGEAGIIVPPVGYLTKARALCTKYNVLLVVDEVQTGLGRTGTLFGIDAENEKVNPDVMLIAKALGGGLVPVGAVLCQSHAYSDRFGLRHSSTFAGNALATQAGLASLDILLDDDQALIQHVAECGEYLRAGLEGIQRKYPALVKEVRGRGYMQAIEFDFSPLDNRRGMLGFLADQQLLIYLFASQLLHVYGVRVAPSFVGRDVIRIEPSLIAGHSEIDQFLDAIDATLALIDAGHTAALLAPMAGADPAEVAGALRMSSAPTSLTSPTASSPSPIDAQYGFLIHLSSLNDLVSYDDSLAAFDETQLRHLKKQLVRSADPFVIGEAVTRSRTGKTIRGHFVMVPYTPQELKAMEPEAALEQVTIAAQVARDAGAELIGLGGFTSIVSMGGVALPEDELPPITSGNSFTVAASLMALQDACAAQNRNISECTAAVVGATGQTGRALAMVLGSQAARLILIGRDGQSAATQDRLSEVAAAVVGHLCETINEQQMRSSKLFSDVADLDDAGRALVLEKLLSSGRIVLANSLDELAEADLVVTASSATESFIETHQLKQDAIVVDASRPANVSEQVRALRQDITWIEGGIIKVPGEPLLDVFAGPTADQTFACVAEAMLWALEPSIRAAQTELVLDPHRIRRLAELSEKHGFDLA